MSRLVLHRSAEFALASGRAVVKRDEVSAVADAIALLERLEAMRGALDAQCDELRGQAREAGREEGLRAGREAADAALQAALVALDGRLVAERQAMHERVVALALRVVERIAQTLGPSATVAALARQVLGELDETRPLRVRVHPAIALQVQRALGADVGGRSASGLLAVAADETLAPFGCEIDSDGGRIEAGLEVQLAALGEALAGIARERLGE